MGEGCTRPMVVATPGAKPGRTISATSPAKRLQPVDAYPDGAGPYGHLDLLGNVTGVDLHALGLASCQTSQFPYPYAADDGREDAGPQPRRDKAYRIHRGGSYRSKPESLHAAARSRAEENSRSKGRGFRVVMEI